MFLCDMCSHAFNCISDVLIVMFLCDMCSRAFNCISDVLIVMFLCDMCSHAFNCLVLLVDGFPSLHIYSSFTENTKQL